MSWPQWQPPSQPGMPMMNTAMPIGIQYTAEQWQNWQQWAQWQQQYQQWHQQYGADYQKSLTAMANLGNAALGTVPTMINTAAPPPLPTDTKQPPPPPEEPSTAAPIVPPMKPTAQNNFLKGNSFGNTTNIQPQNSFGNATNTQPQNSFGNTTNNAHGYNSMPDAKKDTVNTAPWQPNMPQTSNKPVAQQDFRNSKRTSSVPVEVNIEPKKNKLDWQPPPNVTQNPPTSQTNFNEKPEELSDPEKKFMKQFAEWEAQFNKWKEQNQDHPDKTQYREYEKKWEAWRNQLLERRDAMRKKRLGLLNSTSNNTPSENPNNSIVTSSKNLAFSTTSTFDNPQQNSNDPPINPINSSTLATLFKNNSNDGIPGLDLVDAPAQPDVIPKAEKPTNQSVPDPKASGLNLDALSKNLNSILGDQKLLSMLNLVTQNSNLAQKTEPLSTPIDNSVPPLIQNTPPSSGITLAPKITHDDQASNWSTITNISGNSNATSWNQDINTRNNRRFDNDNNCNMNQNYNTGTSNLDRNPNPGFGGRDNLVSRDNFGQRDNSFGQRDNSFGQRDNSFGQRDNSFGQRDNSFGRNSSFSSNNDFPREAQYDYDQNESRFMDKNPVMNQRENSYDGYGDDYWHENNNPKDSNINIPPAPPTITDFDEILQIDKLINYNHKSIKQDSCDVKIILPHVFDYRHKLVSRIPFPDRPKWLNETFHNIPEFTPPIVRTNVPSYSRYPPNYHPPSGPISFNRYDSPGPTPNYKRYDDYNTFSRRPPMEYDLDKERYRNKYSDNYDLQAGKRGRDSRERSDWERDRDRDSRGRDFNTRKGRNSRDRDDISTSQNINKDTKSDGDGNERGFTNVGSKQDEFSRNKSDSDFNNRPRHCVKTSIDDILNMPGRVKRPPRIVIILRGPPGSGKTFLAKQIKDKEAENGGSAPRILSLDDYFMVEQEKEVIEDGKTVKVKEMVYEYEECMEAAYRQSLLKTFKKTITDGYFSFIIVDNVNDKIKYFEEMWSFAKQNGFQVYVSQLELDVQICTKRNTHGRSEVEIQHIVNGWEELPSHYGILDVTNLVQAGSIAEVEMEEINSPNDDFDDDENENEEQACNSSKWDNFECSIDNLAKLDGINKPLRSAGTMEDYLQLDEWTEQPSRVYKPGQKRVRWADLEERKEQQKMRAIGFVVGQTDWGRMMDPSQGSSALTQTKYIERVGIRKVNTN